jgi:hypothetical protein
MPCGVVIRSNFVNRLTELFLIGSMQLDAWVHTGHIGDTSVRAQRKKGQACRAEW